VLKLKEEIVIDADCETVWDAFNSVDDEGRWQVTDKRRPSFIAGNYVTDGSTAVVVNQFEELGPAQTRWLVFANYRFKGLTKLLAVFGAGTVRKRTIANMERFKLFVETHVANEQK
jgi:hypothetical protein